MASFTGTLDKCKACDKTVYFVDLLSADGTTYHKSCFKCSHCKGTLVVHFQQLFLEKGNYQHVLQAAAAHKKSTVQPKDSDQPETERPETKPDPDNDTKSEPDSNPEEPEEPQPQT
ncbi:LIM domain-containing protein PLIM2a [Striga hermonthica]|uniref:LIM domain-containing protein PLIM2a n=1 Tax=Striga hermonthica TaxID=68872 RepID=A0A9N7RSA8_STRHE|nr:LIM domain-containing protein PLIM2a [Striga hermonthica]